MKVGSRQTSWMNFAPKEGRSLSDEEVNRWTTADFAKSIIQRESKDIVNQETFWHFIRGGVVLWKSKAHLRFCRVCKLKYSPERATAGLIVPTVAGQTSLLHFLPAYLPFLLFNLDSLTPNIYISRAYGRMRNSFHCSHKYARESLHHHQSSADRAPKLHSPALTTPGDAE